VSKESKVTQKMVDNLVAPEVQAKILELYKDIPMDSVRLAWPFKTDAERKFMHNWLNKKRRQDKAKALIKLGISPL
jgi:hypothetical protein